MATHISDKILSFCTEPKSVSSEYAKDPTKTPGQHADHLYGRELPAVTEHQPPHLRKPPTLDDIARARQCGNWGDSNPSDLFLQCYHDALCSLEYDPLAGMISPSLMGSSGVVPLTIIAPLPDICRHMSNLIARAEHEVFLATNFWTASDASRLITDSLLELNKRAGARTQKIIVKIMYDRGNVKQVKDNHQIVTVEEYTSKVVQLPHPSEVPNIDMQVQNYHRPVLGTFHSKFMIVDRKIAIIQSNNIQDNDNLEMMTHLEGPVVDSFYDTALLSWYTAMAPPLPLLSSPAMAARGNTFDEPSFRSFFDGVADDSDQRRELLPLHAAADPHYDPDIASEVRRMQDVLTPLQGESRVGAITRHLNLATKLSQNGVAPESELGEGMTPMIPHKPHHSLPIALVNRRPWGAINHQGVNTPQNEAWLSAIRNATSSVFIQSPNVNAAPLIPTLKEALLRGVEVTYYVCLGYNDAGELLPFQGGVNEMVADKLYESLDKASKQRLNVHYYVAKDQVAPIHNSFKKRSCHIKLLIADGHVGIQGNGNQDTQSYFHSMEVNVMIDSEQICGEWRDAIERNQSMFTYLH
ncbi:hypothetical protein SLS60_003331 [Paraconiothyrium brasiliense]|uniref:PLD phosphodiesterase domain-containing protein n=1 Tax=Paraconiothyrium brasiliense TaxID=300254 RepID=A0ABR3RVD5_9PLEO